MKIIEKIKWLLLCISILLTTIMYHPDIYNSDLYGDTRLLVMGILGCLTLLSISSFKRLIGIELFKKVFIISLIVGTEFVLFSTFSLRVTWDDFIQLVLILLFLVIGISIKYNRKSLLIICTLYCITTLIIGAFSVSFYLGGFDIMGNLSLIEGKNQLGAIVALGGGTAFYLSQQFHSKIRFAYIAIALIILALLSVIRCRTALVGYIFFVALYVWRFWSKESKMYFFLLLFFISVFYYNNIIELFNAIIIENKDTEDLNALSTGRLTRNIQGFNYLFLHFFDGELYESSGIELIHNYLLLRLVRYGIWGIPFCILYFIFLIEIIKVIISKQKSISNIGIYLLIISFFCSLLEPSAPFGPGTIYMFAYILFGIYLRYSTAR